MYILTGAAGFIGSAFLSKLNQEGVQDIIAVDSLEQSNKWRNLCGKQFADYLDKDEFLELVLAETLPPNISAIIHLGACSSTTERNVDYLMRNNFKYSVALAEFARKSGIRLIYASSAATYGDGSLGYSDNGDPQYLRPLNPYGFSKNLFDIYMQRSTFAQKAVGLKFFNVFGPNEYHKGEMRSVVLKAYEQIKHSGKVRLFKSYRPDFKDGEQKRDFIYVKDCCQVMWWLLNNPSVTGLYNLGSGRARTWIDLARAVFSAMKLPEKMEFIEMPDELREQYQYFTEAPMQKLKEAGYDAAFLTLEEGVKDYVQNYLEKGSATL